MKTLFIYKCPKCGCNFRHTEGSGLIKDVYEIEQTCRPCFETEKNELLRNTFLLAHDTVGVSSSPTKDYKYDEISL